MLFQQNCRDMLTQWLILVLVCVTTSLWGPSFCFCGRILAILGTCLG